jgi:hypothetical protein
LHHGYPDPTHWDYTSVILMGCTGRTATRRGGVIKIRRRRESRRCEKRVKEMLKKAYR